jgi:hypothetical protein
MLLDRSVSIIYPDILNSREVLSQEGNIPVEKLDSK